MIFPNEMEVERIRNEFPVGCRVRLVKMDDAQAPPINTEGVVYEVDDAGCLIVLWDNGSWWGVVYDADMAVRLDGQYEKYTTSVLSDGWIEGFGWSYSSKLDETRDVTEEWKKGLFKPSDGEEYTFKDIWPDVDITYFRSDDDYLLTCDPDSELQDTRVTIQIHKCIYTENGEQIGESEVVAEASIWLSELIKDYQRNNLNDLNQDNPDMGKRKPH